MSWLRVRVEHGPEGRSAAAHALFAAGALAVLEESNALVTRLSVDGAERARELVLAGDLGASVFVEREASVDWAERWKEGIRAHELGAITISPPWLASRFDATRTVVIEPGMAFGTGEHPTTRGVVQLMQRVIRKGDVVADLGAGSAVLAIAAAKLGARAVYAIEQDAEAIPNAEENVARNGVGDRVRLIRGEAALLLPLVAPVGVVLANIVSSVILELLPAIAAALCDGGTAVISGILTSERDEVEDALGVSGGGMDDPGITHGGDLVERGDRASLASFYAPDATFAAGASVGLGEEAVQHARARRLAAGAAVFLFDGRGRRAVATLVRLGRRDAVAEVESVENPVEPLEPVHMLVPIADRERMLWLAEKVAELGGTSWRPVSWKRSRSVTPRGEGSTFQMKARARMTGALAQSRGSWLPDMFPDATVERAIAATPPGSRLLLDPGGAPILSVALASPVTLVVGPEGGMEAEERERFIAAGFAPVSVAGHILRFETAAVAALAVVRAALAHNARYPDVS